MLAGRPQALNETDDLEATIDVVARGALQRRPAGAGRRRSRPADATMRGSGSRWPAVGECFVAKGIAEFVPPPAQKHSSRSRPDPRRGPRELVIGFTRQRSCGVAGDDDRSHHPGGRPARLLSAARRRRAASATSPPALGLGSPPADHRADSFSPASPSVGAVLARIEQAAGPAAETTRKRSLLGWRIGQRSNLTSAL